MSKYRIIVENIGEGANYEGRTPLECDGFVIMAMSDDEKYFKAGIAMHDVSRDEVAKAIKDISQLRSAARVGLAMYEADQDEDVHRNPLASIISSIRPIAEDD